MSLTRSFPLAALALTSLLVASGCAWAGPQHKREVDLTVQHVDHAGVEVTAKNGGIRIVQADVESVEIHAKLSSPDLERLDQATVHAVRGDDDTLTVYCEWPTKRKGNEGCAFEVRVPNASGIHAETANGAIRVESLAGDADLRTANGSITLLGHYGQVDAKTSNGSITIEDAQGRVDADTSNGSITIRLADDNAGPVKADTSNGSIRLEVGPAFAGAVEADTSMGRVTVGPFPDAYDVVVRTQKKTHASVVFGEGGSKTSLDTSLGSITIAARGG